MEHGLSIQGDEPNRKQHELSQTGAAAKEQHEIQSAIIIAKRFPRDEDACFQKLMKAASRPSFAEDAAYSFPRGDTDVTGPSVNLAREAARIWGNIRYGLYIVRDDDGSRLIRGWCWDVETNMKNEFDDDFKKLIQRKDKNTKETKWIICDDERELRELTNRRGAILVRNAILQNLPKDLIEDALFQCRKTLEASAGDNPEGMRKRLLVDFGSINITVAQLEQKLGHPFAQSTPKEIAQLRSVCKSIQDGNTTWAEYIKEKDAEQKPVEDANKAKLAAAQEKLKQRREQPKAEPMKVDPKKQENGKGDVGHTQPLHTTAFTPGSNQDAPSPPPSDGLDAAWLSRVMDAEDYLRGSVQGKNSLRSIRAGFRIEDGSYPLLPQDQKDFLSDLERTVERLQKAH